MYSHFEFDVMNASYEWDEHKDAANFVHSKKKIQSVLFPRGSPLFRKRRDIRMVKMNFNEINTELSSDELKELEDAAARAIVYDEESPEMTPEMLKQFKQLKQKSRTKQTASIRLSEKAQKFSKSYGKGYTSFFSRLIDAALDDAALVKKCL